MEEMIYYSCVIKKQAHNRAANSVLRGSISFFLFFTCIHLFEFLLCGWCVRKIFSVLMVSKN